MCTAQQTVLWLKNMFYNSQLKGMARRQVVAGRSWSSLLSSVKPLIKTFPSPWQNYFLRFAVRLNLVSAFPHIGSISGCLAENPWCGLLWNLKMFGGNVKNWRSWRMCRREEFFSSLVIPPPFGINALYVYLCMCIYILSLISTVCIWLTQLRFELSTCIFSIESSCTQY